MIRLDGTASPGSDPVPKRLAALAVDELLSFGSGDGQKTIEFSRGT